MPTFGIAPLVLHVPLLKQSVKESLRSIGHGCQVEILLGSAHQGLCNHDFPVHRVMPRRTVMMMMMISDDGGFHSVPWNWIAS